MLKSRKNQLFNHSVIDALLLPAQLLDRAD